jgi:hypothetical protein
MERKKREDRRSNHTAVLPYHDGNWSSDFRVVAKVQVSVSGSSIFFSHYQEIRSYNLLGGYVLVNRFMPS